MAKITTLNNFEYGVTDKNYEVKEPRSLGTLVFFGMLAAVAVIAAGVSLGIWISN